MKSSSNFIASSYSIKLVHRLNAQLMNCSAIFQQLILIASNRRVV